MCAHSGLTDQAWLARHVVKGEIAGPRASNVMKIIKPSTLLLAPVRLGQQGNGIYYGAIMLLCVADQQVSSCGYRTRKQTLQGAGTVSMFGLLVLLVAPLQDHASCKGRMAAL